MNELKEKFAALFPQSKWVKTAALWIWWHAVAFVVATAIVSLFLPFKWALWTAASAFVGLIIGNVIFVPILNRLIRRIKSRFDAVRKKERVRT